MDSAVVFQLYKILQNYIKTKRCVSANNMFVRQCELQGIARQFKGKQDKERLWHGWNEQSRALSDCFIQSLLPYIELTMKWWLTDRVTKATTRTRFVNTNMSNMSRPPVITKHIQTRSCPELEVEIKYIRCLVTRKALLLSFYFVFSHHILTF